MGGGCSTVISGGVATAAGTTQSDLKQKIVINTISYCKVTVFMYLLLYALLFKVSGFAYRKDSHFFDMDSATFIRVSPKHLHTFWSNPINHQNRYSTV